MVSVFGAFQSHAMLHKDCEDFPGLRSRTAHMVSHKAIWAMKQVKPPHNLSFHQPSPLCSLSPFGAFSLFLLSIKSRYLSSLNSYPPCSRSIIFKHRQSRYLILGPQSSHTPSQYPDPESNIGSRNSAGPQTSHIYISSSIPLPLLLAKQDYFLNIHPANTKKLVHAELLIVSTIIQHTK